MHPGTRLGPYEIADLLGVGGMGAVYRARDTKLHRDVAIKVLLPAVAHDGDRLARFEREARILASLNHPNIAAIYGLEEVAGSTALVLELVEGQTLAKRIAQSPVPYDEVLRIARQIAEALEAAHERGLIHRDLKPANIKITPANVVKVLDFGLAKVTEADDHRLATSREPSITRAAITDAGTILGTTAYMSPEQAEGKSVDKRSDLWSFGIVLLEMLTGQPAFKGETAAQVLAAVLKEEPDWTTLPAATPEPLRRLLRRCLEKDRKKRLADAADARLEIEDALTHQAPDPEVSLHRRSATMALAGVLGGAVLAATATWSLMRPTPPEAVSVTRFAITPITGLPLSSTDFNVAVAPDGSFLVYSVGAQKQLVVRRLDRLDASPLAGVNNASYPAVSPDNRWIAFVEDGSTLKKVAISGGAPVVLAQLPGALRGAGWIDDTSLIVATNTPSAGLMRVAADGGDPVVLTIPDRHKGETGHVFPSVLPDARSVVFTVLADNEADAQVALLDLSTGQRKMLMRGARGAIYVASGHLVFAAGEGLSAVRFDTTRREVVGNTVQVVDRVAKVTAGGTPAVVARAGTLAYVVGATDSGSLNRSLAWVDRHGQETLIHAPSRAYGSPSLSPDGTKVAVDSLEGQGGDIWVWDETRQTLARLTFDPASDISPNWTPDGRAIVFASTRDGPYALYARAADGTGSDVRVSTGAHLQVPTSVTPDGAFVVGYAVLPRTGRDLVRFALDAPRELQPSPATEEALLKTPAAELNGDVSPNGRFLAYQSNESGRMEIYVRPYPSVSSGRWQVTTRGGSQPTWTRAGNELVYLDDTGRIAAVSTETTTTFRAGTPTLHLNTAYSVPNITRSYDVSSDGQLFVVIKDHPTQAVTPLTLVVVEHWSTELNRLLPPTR